MNQALLNNSVKNEDLLIQQNRKNSKKSDNNNNSNLSINHDLLNLNQDNNLLSENLNNVSYNDLNYLNSQLIKNINNNNFNFNQFNLDEINNTNDNFRQNNLSNKKNDLRNLDYFNLLDYDNENLDFDNFNGNIHIGNVDEIENLNDIPHKINSKNKNRNVQMGKNFENPENKFFDFVLNQVQKKNLDKKSKKIKNKKLDSLLSDVNSNLANSRIFNDDNEFNSNSQVDNSLNIHFKNENSQKPRRISKKEEIDFLEEIENSIKKNNVFLINFKNIIYFNIFLLPLYCYCHVNLRSINLMIKIEKFIKKNLI
jgi:hypothetical protein